MERVELNFGKRFGVSARVRPDFKADFAIRLPMGAGPESGVDQFRDLVGDVARLHQRFADKDRLGTAGHEALNVAARVDATFGDQQAAAGGRIVGAEEQMPQLGRIPVQRLFGMGIPHIPIPATPIPLPVRYHILYGEPLRFDREFKPDDADDPEILAACAKRVHDAVEALIHRGLRERQGIFA